GAFADVIAKIDDQDAITLSGMEPAQHEGTLAQYHAVEAMATLATNHRILMPQRQQVAVQAQCEIPVIALAPVELAALEGGLIGGIFQRLQRIGGRSAGKLCQEFGAARPHLRAQRLLVISKEQERRRSAELLPHEQ